MIASELTGTDGIVALAAAAVAVMAIVWCAILMRSLRRIRNDQRALLGGSRATDLVSHAASLQEGFEAVRDYTSEVAETLDGRLSELERALRSALSHTSLVHYDAYNELSGQQSISLALMDGTSSGIVLTCIHHRDQARVYAKRLADGQSDRELSPEEAEAVRIACSEPARREDALRQAG